MLKVKRQQMLNGFISTIVKESDLDVSEFWKFREFYSPGYFTHNETNVNYVQPFVIVNNLKTSGIISELLTYNSKLLKSHDSLLDEDVDLTEIVATFEDADVLINSNKLCLFEMDNRYHLYFIKPIDQMMEVNGLFDYRSGERELLKNKVWFNYTVIEIPK